ncbi:MAG TPA: 8-oxoguanine deaminase [Ktedonobacteraceae bacterium]|nr:8-oxoguanine deaminase [Ktedonobacteraceae bacterium]
MASLLVKNAELIVTMDDNDTCLSDGSIYIIDNEIRQLGPTNQLPQQADTIIDARNMIILPGLINTHHHFYQTLTRNLPAAQDVSLFQWLRTLYPIWAGLTPEAIYISTKVAIAELMLSGCTTSSDHTYIWPNGARLDDQIQAAAEMGFRFHAARGSMSVGETQGGLPPDNVVEDEAAIMRDSQRLIEQYHDASRYAMCRIVLAPCSPFSVSPRLMQQSAELARSYGVHLHTHLAETQDEAQYCTATFHRSPVELAEDLGWVGPDVWHAHMVHPGEDEITRLGKTRTGVAHCPSSNMRLSSGIAPVRKLLQAGVRVGLGVDGSASNDSSDMLAEARQAMLLQRVMGDPAAMTAREALWLATRGSANVLGRDDTGYLAPSMAADLIGYRLDTLALAGGAPHDSRAALIFCRPSYVDLSIINGRVRIKDQTLLDIDLPALIQRHNAIARALASKTMS